MTLSCDPEQLRAETNKFKKLPCASVHGLLPLGKVMEFQTLKTVNRFFATRAAAPRNGEPQDPRHRRLRPRGRAKDQGASQTAGKLSHRIRGQFENLQKARTAGLSCPGNPGLISCSYSWNSAACGNADYLHRRAAVARDRRRAALWLCGMTFSISAAGVHRVERWSQCSRP